MEKSLVNPYWEGLSVCQLVDPSVACFYKNYHKISPSVESSLLVQLESENAAKIPNVDIRTIQRLLSLAYFGKLCVGEAKPKRVSDVDFDVFSKNEKIFTEQLRNFRKRARTDFIRTAEAKPRGLRFQTISK